MNGASSNVRSSLNIHYMRAHHSQKSLNNVTPLFQHDDLTALISGYSDNVLVETVIQAFLLMVCPSAIHITSFFSRSVTKDAKFHPFLELLVLATVQLVSMLRPHAY